MKNGQCPKCNSTNVFKSENGLSMGGHTTTLQIFTGPFNSSLPAGCESYVCADCGYFENYIVTKDRLEEVRKQWKKVQ